MNPFKYSVVCLVILLSLFYSNAYGNEAGISPKKHPNMGKWRIAYYEGGEYIDYQKTLIATLNGLMELGWIDNMNFDPSKLNGTQEIWNRLSDNSASSFIQFVPDAFYSASWDDSIRKKTAASIIDRFNKKKNIDLVIAMGTWAGQDLANNRHNVPTVVMSTSNALKSNIIKSIKDSGYDHVHAQIDPKREEHQLRLFYNTVKFKKLGVIYEDTVAGRSYAAVDEIEKLSKELGFEIKRCFAEGDIPDPHVADLNFITCFDKLVKTADAIYVTTHSGLNKRTIPKLAEIAIEHEIPTFSEPGSDEVKYGLLLSLSQKSFRQVGLFEAAIIAKIFNNAKPRELPQVFEASRTLAINLKTAELIGFSINLPIEVLAAADEFYREIIRPE